MLAFFMPGPMEMLIILFVLGMMVLPVAALVYVVFLLRKRQPPTPDTAPCPSCGGWTVAQASFCHHCGARLAG